MPKRWVVSPYLFPCTSHQALNVIPLCPNSGTDYKWIHNLWIILVPLVLWEQALYEVQHHGFSSNHKWLWKHIYCNCQVATDLPSTSLLRALLTEAAAFQPTTSTSCSLVVTGAYIWLLMKNPSLPSFFPTSGSTCSWQASEIFISEKAHLLPAVCFPNQIIQLISCLS